MKIALEKMQADKKLLVSETMKLSQADAAVFWPVYNSYQEILLNLTKRLIKVIDNYAKNYNNMTEANAKELLDEYLAVERGIPASLLKFPLVNTIPNREYAAITSDGKGMARFTTLLSSSSAEDIA